MVLFHSEYPGINRTTNASVVKRLVKYGCESGLVRPILVSWYLCSNLFLSIQHFPESHICQIITLICRRKRYRRVTKICIALKMIFVLNRLNVDPSSIPLRVIITQNYQSK